MRTFKAIVSGAVLLAFANAHFCCPAQSATSKSAESKKSGAVQPEALKEVEKEIRALLSEYYPAAKITSKGNKIHFELKLRPFLIPISNKQEMAPDLGGILGDLELVEGEYTGPEKLPKQLNQYAFQRVLLMAPYKEDIDSHLYARLAYPEDAPPEFLQTFRAMMRDFEARSPKSTEPSSTQSAEPSSTKSTRPYSTKSTEPSSTKSAAPSSTKSAAPSSTKSTAPSSTNLPATQPKPARKNIFMWKATRDKDVVYLLGTVHAGKEDFYPLAPEIDKALEECKALIVEIAIDKVDLNKMKVTATSKATYSPPDKLSAHLSAPTKRIFDDYLAWAGESWEMYEKYRPWFVRSLIGASPRWSTETIRSRLGIDRYLIGRARELKKDVLDLETPDFQLKISADLPENLQDKLLAVSILDLKNSGNDVKNIVYAWKGGDSEKMYDVVTRDMREYPELTPYYKRLVDDRNVSMTKTLTELFAKSSGPYLVAVGAGHLVGKTGLVSQFKERGYTVEQCNTDMRASDSSISPDVKKFVKRFKNPDGKAPGAPGSNVEKPAGNITRSSGQQ